MTLNLNSPPQMHTDFTPRITVIGDRKSVV